MFWNVRWIPHILVQFFFLSVFHIHSGNKNMGLQSVVCDSEVQNTLENYFLCVCLAAIWRQTCHAPKVTASHTCPGQVETSVIFILSSQCVCPHVCKGGFWLPGAPQTFQDVMWFTVYMPCTFSKIWRRSELDTYVIQRVWGKGLQAYILKKNRIWVFLDNDRSYGTINSFYRWRNWGSEC